MASVNLDRKQPFTRWVMAMGIPLPGRRLMPVMNGPGRNFYLARAVLAAAAGHWIGARQTGY